MSSAPAHGPDTHDDHAFTGEPVQVLSPDEPRTPGWIPLLGIAFFTVAAIGFLSSGSSADTSKDGAAAPPPSPNAMADAPRPAAPAGTAAARPSLRPLPPLGAASGAAPTGTQAQPRSITAEQRQQLMKQMGKGRAPAGH